MSDPRQAPRRHEWMPNRMFDPATNPFAIQNLLKKEKKEDTPFLLKRDERPVFGYSDDALLNESKIQPAVDFQFDDLLAWAEVAANSDEFYRAVVADYWKLLVGKAPSEDDLALFADYETTWRSLADDPQHSVFEMLHVLIETEAYGAP